MKGPKLPRIESDSCNEPRSLPAAVRRALSIGLCSGLALCTAPVRATVPFPAVFELSTLDGSNGFVLNGNASDFSGRALSGAGDINGDGWPDLMIGAAGATRNGKTQAGAVYVVFGGPGVGSSGSIELADLDGSKGFVIEGSQTNDGVGTAMGGAGDVNGDGRPDLLVGAVGIDLPGLDSPGAAYVIFGRPGLGASGLVDLSFDGSDGIALTGVYAHGFVGTSVDFTGDFNADGIDDLIVGGDGVAIHGLPTTGQAYVVFGNTNFGGNGARPLLPQDGIAGFAVDGTATKQFLGGSVSAIGDVNGDGVVDLAIGAIGADPGGRDSAGEVYVLFGHSGSFVPHLDPATLNGSTGFALRGVDAGDLCGLSVSGAGDVNGDGVADLIVGALRASPNGATGAGSAYVVFGGTTLGSGGSLELSALNGANGFVIPGLEPDDDTGGLVAPAGDVNGDGLADLLVGAYKADPEGRSEAGASYIVFGAAGLGAGGTLDLTALDGSNGFVVPGIAPGDRLTRNTSFGAALGDINGDGADDLLLGAPNASPHGAQSAGQSYVVLGRPLDTDADGIGDRRDNCTLVANPDQRDTDGDGFGNLCDPDLNEDGVVNFGDLGLLKSVFFTNDADADFDGSGFVNFGDLGILKQFFFQPPGPSGLVP